MAPELFLREEIFAGFFLANCRPTLVNGQEKLTIKRRGQLISFAADPKARWQVNDTISQQSATTFLPIPALVTEHRRCVYSFDFNKQI